MSQLILNMLLAFVEGIGLIVSPCILPILPLILSGSLTGGKARPLGIIVGFIVSFTLFTLFSRWLVLATHINQEMLRYISFAILIFLGVVMISTTLSEKFILMTNRLMGVGDSIKFAHQREGGFASGLVFGILVGIIWTPCAGPILAAVIVQVVLQHTTVSSLLVVFAFALGVALPMLLIALLGRGVLDHFTVVRQHAHLLRKILGVIIIATVAIFIFFPELPAYLESGPSQTSQKDISHTQLINPLTLPYKAPEIIGITAWINSQPLTISALKGKVVLIDFWTYSCINCIRTLPYLLSWYAKYHDQGFEIIGIHTPEFEFEKDLTNVQNAVAKFKISYPVALDNNYKTWLNYQNHYWPAHYLINQNGMVVYEHFGEGEYATTENNIRVLLGLNKMIAATSGQTAVNYEQTPETYLGYARGQAENTNYPVNDTPTVYNYPNKLSLHSWALSGNWQVNRDKVVAQAPGCAIKLNFQAGKVYAVMGSHSGFKIPVSVYLNDKLISKLNIDRNQLYTLLDMPQTINGVLTLSTDQAGLEVYTFTFGS